MKQEHSTKSDGGNWWDCGCWHIGRWNAAGTFFTIAIKRCFKARSTADTTMQRGMYGDRSWYGLHLEPKSESNPLQLVKCNPDHCNCHRWRTGHLWTPENPAPDPDPRPFYVCGDCGIDQEPDRQACGEGRREVWPVMNTVTERVTVYCRKCYPLAVVRLNQSGILAGVPKNPLRPFSARNKDGDLHHASELARAEIFPVLMANPKRPPEHRQPLIP